MKEYILYRTVVMISDLHLADPDHPGLNDFTCAQEFESLLELIPKIAKGLATLIIAGDFIDFPQVLPELARHDVGDRFGCTEVESVRKISLVIDSHRRVFNALKNFIKEGHQVLIVPGNHDIDFHWPLVFDAFRLALDNPSEPNLCFVSQGFLREKGIYIEHGNQYSFDNWFEYWSDPLRLAPDGNIRIERPWGTLFMDVVYTDIKAIHPFINKVYPHSKLALIALRSITEKSGVSVASLARLVAFLVTKGNRWGWNRLMGNSPNNNSAQNPSIEVVSSLATSIESFLAQSAPEATVEFRRAIGNETLILLNTLPVHLTRPRLTPQETGLLGRSDEKGMTEREVELHESGEIVLVAFGHTHHAVDGNDAPRWGTRDSRRGFNTGSWIPVIPLRDNQSPHWSQLPNISTQHNIHYLVIRLEETPTATLESLAIGPK